MNQKQKPIYASRISPRMAQLYEKKLQALAEKDLAQHRPERREGESTIACGVLRVLSQPDVQRSLGRGPFVDLYALAAELLDHFHPDHENPCLNVSLPGHKYNTDGLWVRYWRDKADVAWFWLWMSGVNTGVPRSMKFVTPQLLVKTMQEQPAEWKKIHAETIWDAVILRDQILDLGS